jgi:hypothetical protein
MFYFLKTCGDPSGSDLNVLVEQLSSKIAKINQGELAVVDSILAAQAHTLDVIFNNMIIRTACSKLISGAQVYSEIAFKAQNQCRKTLITLSELKNPKTATFVNQQNMALNQQINNGVQHPMQILKIPKI